MRRFAKIFYKNDDGVTAIEFAIFAVPFLLLIMGIIEIGIMTGAATVMNGATEDAARQIRTGQAQGSADAEKWFKDELCNNVYALLDCNKFTYHVITLAKDEDFTDASTDTTIMPPIVDPADNTKLSASQFHPGKQNDRIIVRVSYDYPILTPMAGLLSILSGSSNKGFEDRPNRKRLLVSTAIIQNEPY